MRRIVLFLSAATLVAAITAFSSASAFAQEPVCTEEPLGEGGMGQWTVTCVETEVVNEEVKTPSTEDCEVRTSGMPGTQEGDLVRTAQVTLETTTTSIYQGNPAGGEEPISVTESDPVEVDRVEGTETTFEPTGPCRPIAVHPA
jgi:hypothetical protein